MIDVYNNSNVNEPFLTNDARSITCSSNLLHKSAVSFAEAELSIPPIVLYRSSSELELCHSSGSERNIYHGENSLSGPFVVLDVDAKS